VREGDDIHTAGSIVAVAKRTGPVAVCAVEERVALDTPAMELAKSSWLVSLDFHGGHKPAIARLEKRPGTQHSRTGAGSRGWY